MGVTWYLSNDMQMYWYSPVVLLPIWWNEKIGLALWCVQFLAFTSVQGVLTAYYHFGPTSMIGPDEHVVHGSLTQGSYYGKVYTRMQPYLIGLLMGYIFFKTRGKTIKFPYVRNFSLSFQIITFNTVIKTIFTKYVFYRASLLAVFYGYCLLELDYLSYLECNQCGSMVIQTSSPPFMLCSLGLVGH